MGKLALIINVITYSLTGIVHGSETMLYSIISAIFYSQAIDKYHTQNICSTAVLFCKDSTLKLEKFIKKELRRNYTFWTVTGGNDKKTIHIIYIALSKYELGRLEKYLKYHNENIFMVNSEGVGVKGNFKKQF